MALILVIDDDPFYCNLIEQALTGRGHKVLTARNGAKGISLFLDRTPELVITDMLMPGFNGTEVIRALVRTNVRARIIAVSNAVGDYALGLFKAALALGADVVLNKLDPVERLVLEADALLKASG